MAKKGKRPRIMLVCDKCKMRNYYTSRNVINTPKKIELNKYCPKCKIKTLHKETKLPPHKKA
jgi:large subunit ribosomal protein L33